MEKLKNRVIELLDSHFEGTDYFIVDVTVAPGDKIRVFADAHQHNIKIAECAKISRHLENILEEEGSVAEKWGIEVSSPGMSNSFKVEAQYQKALNKPVSLKTKSGKKEKGILIKVSEDAVSIEKHSKVKGKKQPEVKVLSFDRKDIKEIKRQIIINQK